VHHFVRDLLGRGGIAITADNYASVIPKLKTDAVAASTRS
jgi:hypothetical protein